MRSARVCVRNNTLAILCQCVVILVGIGALVFLLWEPRVEGRNVHATVFQMYFQDAFLAYAYIASVPFFVALGQVFFIFRSFSRRQARASDVMRSLRLIRRCAFSVIGFVLVGEVWLRMSESDDRAGGVLMGVLISVGAIVMATAATYCERTLRCIVLKPSAQKEGDL